MDDEDRAKRAEYQAYIDRATADFLRTVSPYMRAVGLASVSIKVERVARASITVE